MEQEVKEQIARCRAEVLTHPQHVLSFAARRELLRRLGPMILDERGFGRELHYGKKRRVELALLCATRTCDSFERAWSSSSVQVLLQLIRDYLDGRGSIAPVKKATDALQGGLLNGPAGHDDAYLAGRAACGCGWVAIGDEVLVPDAGVSEDELNAPQDPDLWDPAFFAAASFAGGIPGAPRFSSGRMRDFWIWYLDVAVAAACGSHKDPGP